jgi:hypothetical protein
MSGASMTACNLGRLKIRALEIPDSRGQLLEAPGPAPGRNCLAHQAETHWRRCLHMRRARRAKYDRPRCAREVAYLEVFEER